MTAADAEATARRGTPGDRPPLTAQSTIRVHPLGMRADHGSWIIGRADTGDFVQVPEVAHRILLLLSNDRTVGQVSDALRSEGYEPVDVADFILDLADLDFIDAIDHHQLPQLDPPQPSLRWLKPRHTSWTLHPGTALAAAGIVAAGIGCLAAHPDVVPTYHALVWSRWSGVVLAGNMTIAWVLIFVHELSHLATARAAGIPARLSLGTRLQFLTAQTDVTGVWTQPRRIRVTVYLAGMAVNLVAAALGLIVLATAGSGMPAIVDRIIEAAILLAVLSLPVELCVFMRTDIYFLLQDLTGCLNLYSDGSDYFWYLIGNAAHRARLRSGQPADPLLGLDERERRAVRLYSLVLAVGTMACLAVAICAELPAAALLLSQAAGNLTASPPLAGAGNGAVIALTGGFLAVWMRAWWKRHGQRLQRLLQAGRQQPEGGDAS